MCKSEETSKKFVLIHDQMIDVTRFLRRHPGGSIIQPMVDNDATSHYNEFHFRSKRADKVLKALPSHTATEQELQNVKRAEVAGKDEDALMRDFYRLRADLEREGWFDPNYLHLMYRIIEICVMHYVGWKMLSFFYDAGETIGIYAALCFLGIAMGRCGWFMHECGHYSATGNIEIDRLLQEVFYGLGCGMSATWWRRNHNRHHAYTQHVEFDSDLQTLPLVAFDTRTLDNVVPSSFLKLWIKLQQYLFVPVICPLVALGWQVFLAPKVMLKRGTATEKFWFGLRFSIVAYLCQYRFGWPLGLWYYWVYGCVSAIYIFVNFALSHTHLESHVDDKKNWVEYTSKHTLNMGHNILCNWWMSYLNFQIEHHLFPSMPQFRFPSLKPRIQALFEKHGLTYQYDTYFNSMRRTFANLGEVAASIH